MKNKNTLIIVILSILVFIFGFFQLNKVKHNDELKDNIISVVKENDTLDFSKITDFEWDTLYIFTPYSAPLEVLKSDGVKSFKNNFAIEYNDNIITFAFVNKSKLVSYVDISYYYLDIIGDIENKVSKENAIFNITKSDGNTYLSNQKK